MTTNPKNNPSVQTKTVEIDRIEGYRYGTIIKLEKNTQTVWVNYSGNPFKKDLKATIANNKLTYDDLKKAMETTAVIKLIFDDRHPEKPMITDLFYSFLENETVPPTESQTETLHINADQLVLEAKKEIIIKCGDAFIKLKSDGNQLVIEADNIRSSASETNRIRGGNVLLN